MKLHAMKKRQENFIDVVSVEDWKVTRDEFIEIIDDWALVEADGGIGKLGGEEEGCEVGEEREVILMWQFKNGKIQQFNKLTIW